MIRYIDHLQMGRSRLGWLDSHFHFSFAEYRNPGNVNFGVLRVLNDDLVEPGTGFDTHPHQDFEIISYVVDGELTHADSMANKHLLTRGQSQYMSAGTGITHSEHNRGSEILRFMQIWLFPDQKGYQPGYGDHRFRWEDRIGRWMPMASGDGDSRFPIQVHADIHMYSAVVEPGKELTLAVEPGRQAYLVLIEGDAEINYIAMRERDALEIVEETVTIHAGEAAHMLVIEMAKG